MDKKEQLAYDILDLSRSLLLIRLRFLEPAFLQLMLVPDPEGTFSTDGFSIFYSFHHVLRRYDAAPEQVLSNMTDAVNAFVKETEQFDDLTMLCLEYKGSAAV